MFNRTFKHIGAAVLSANTSLYMIGAMVLLPFIIFHHLLPIPSFYSEWVAGVFGLLALLPLLKRESWQPLDVPQIALIFPGFIAILFMQWMLGMLHSTQYALLVACYLIWAFLLVILGGHLRRQLGWEKIAITIAWFIVAGGLLNALFVGLQLATKFGVALSFMPRYYGYGAIGQVNHFADYTALATASLIYLYTKRKLPLVALIVAGLLFLAMLAFSGSRSTWLYMAALVVLSYALRSMVLRQKNSTSELQIQQSRTLFRLALLILPIFALVQWAIYFLPSGMVTLPTERLMMGDAAGSVGISTVAISGLAIRLHVWHESLQLFMQSPWLGIGAGQMRWMSFAYLSPDIAQGMPGMFENAHNLFIQVMTEMGLGGILLLVAGLVAWLRGFQWRNLNLESWWLLAMLAIIGIHSMLEYPLWYAYFLGITALLLGAGEDKSSQVRFTFTGRAAIVAVLVTGLAVMGSLAIANNNLQYWVYRAKQGNIQPMERQYMSAALEWVDEKSLLSPYARLLFVTTLKADKNRLQDKIMLTQSAMRFVVVSSTAYKLALMLELDGQHEAAVLQLKRTLAAYPKNVTEEVQALPFEYWPMFLGLLSEATAKSKN